MLFTKTVKNKNKMLHICSYCLSIILVLCVSLADTHGIISSLLFIKRGQMMFTSIVNAKWDAVIVRFNIYNNIKSSILPIRMQTAMTVLITLYSTSECFSGNLLQFKTPFNPVIIFDEKCKTIKVS